MTTDELMAEVERLRGVLARIESLVWYEPDDEDDLVEAVRVMACERDEAKDRARRACQLLAKEIGADEHQMHFGIRLDRYKTIADSWRAKVAEVEAERDEARAEVERLRNADPGPSSSG